MVEATELRAREVPLFFKLCSDHLSIEAIPRHSLSIDLNGMKDRAVEGHDLIMWTPHFVVLRNKTGQEITLRKDGRMVVRRAKTDESARDAATALMSLVLK